MRIVSLIFVLVLVTIANGDEKAKSRKQLLAERSVQRQSQQAKKLIPRRCGAGYFSQCYLRERDAAMKSILQNPNYGKAYGGVVKKSQTKKESGPHADFNAYIDSISIR